MQKFEQHTGYSNLWNYLKTQQSTAVPSQQPTGILTPYTTSTYTTSAAANVTSPCKEYGARDYQLLRSAINTLLGKASNDVLPSPPDEIIGKFVADQCQDLDEDEASRILMVLQRYREGNELIFIEYEILSRLLTKVNKMQIDSIKFSLRAVKPSIEASDGEHAFKFDIMLDRHTRVGSIKLRMEIEPAKLAIVTDVAIPSDVRQSIIDRAADELKHRLGAIQLNEFCSPDGTLFDSFSDVKEFVTETTNSAYLNTCLTPQIDWNAERERMVEEERYRLNELAQKRQIELEEIAKEKKRNIEKSIMDIVNKQLLSMINLAT